MMTEKNGSPSSKSKQRNEIMRYSGIATKMGVIIAVMVYAGIKLDEHYSDGGRMWTIILALVGTIAAVYQVIRDLIK